jgi:hypothetical protein
MMYRIIMRKCCARRTQRPPAVSRRRYMSMSLGFTKAVVPPLLDQILLKVAREGCLLGDPNMCQAYIDLGGEFDRPGA